MTTFTEFRSELMGEKPKSGEEALSLTDQQIIEGLRGLVRYAERRQAVAEIALAKALEKADALDNLRVAMKRIEELE
jgi:hypothetical protein